MTPRTFLDNGSTSLPFPQVDVKAMERIAREKIEAIRELAERRGIRLAIVGMDDGINSAVTLALVTRALGPKNVHALCLPANPETAEDEARRGRDLTEALGIPADRYQVIQLQERLARARVDHARFQPLPAFESWRERWEGELVELERLETLRLAAAGLYVFLVGSTTLTAHLLGERRLMGSVTDLEPIRDLFQIETYRLGAHLGLPESVLLRPPVGFTTDDVETVKSIDFVLDCWTRWSPDEALERARESGLDLSLAQTVADQMERATERRKSPVVLNRYRPW